MQTFITATEMAGLPQRYRANLINSLAGYKQAALVGTVSTSGNLNVAVFNSVLHVGANPPFYGLLFRPETTRRDTLNNIRDTGFYTLNYMPTTYIDAMHQTSARYAEGVSEFEATGLVPGWHGDFPAPYVEGAVVKIGLKKQQEIPIELNGTLLVIGSVEAVLLENVAIEEDGFVPLHTADVVACCGLDAYYRPQFVKRLPYARP